MKNLLVFVPVVTAGAVNNIQALYAALLAFLAFCLIASSLYVLNDLLDLEGDRKHPSKRHRPFASGELPIWFGYILIPLLLAAGLAFAVFAHVLLYLVLYAVMSATYSAKLKELPLVDVFLLAALYTVRLFAGGVATGYDVSLWLLAFSCFLFLSLAIIKRVTELEAAAVKDQSDLDRRGYRTSDIGILQTFGVGATFVSAVVLVLYVQSEHVTEVYKHPEVLWWIVPLMLFWQCRLWLATARGNMADDPIVYASTDWVSMIVAAGLFVTMMTAQLMN